MVDGGNKLLLLLLLLLYSFSPFSPFYFFIFTTTIIITIIIIILFLKDHKMSMVLDPRGVRFSSCKIFMVFDSCGLSLRSSLPMSDCVSVAFDAAFGSRDSRFVRDLSSVLSNFEISLVLAFGKRDSTLFEGSAISAEEQVVDPCSLRSS